MLTFYLKLTTGNDFQMSLLPPFRQKEIIPNTYAPNNRDPKYTKLSQRVCPLFTERR